MNFLRTCLLALLIVTGAPALATGDGSWFYAGSDIPPDPAWTFGTLPNGLRYAVRRNALPEKQVSIRIRIAAGSLHEEDHERGWAHFIEHMAFRGTKGFGDGEGRRIWQKLGASFGSDSNASTSPTQTVYQLDLPRADEASLDTSLAVLSEMIDTALFDPTILEAERKVILAEKGRRPELASRMLETSWPVFYAGLKVANRDTIGTTETLLKANPEGMRAFYERWYRPERATVIMVGDADPQAMERLIAKHFGNWQGTGAAPAEPDYGQVAEPAARAASLAYPGAPYSGSLMWLRPYVKTPNTLAAERIDMARSLAVRILNRRLEAKARGEADYVNAAVSENQTAGIADVTQISIIAREGKWREGLEQNFAIIADALRAPPSEAEIAREIKNLKTSAASAVAGEATVKSPQRAQQMVNAINRGSIVTTASTIASVIDQLTSEMTPAHVGAAMKTLFGGSGPRFVLLTPEPIAGGDAVLANALAVAEKAAPASRQVERLVSMDDLPPLGRPGREVSRQHIDDLDVTIVRFANGSTLTFKQTDFEKGSVGVQVRFGHGLVGLNPDRPSLAWLGGLVGPSGLADLDLDGMERLMTGRRMSITFGVGEDAFELQAATSSPDLADQLRLLATKLAYPRWDAPLFARFKTSALQSYDLSFASATSRAGRELGGFTRGGDERWAPVEKTEIASVELKDLQDYFTPLLASGPVDVVIVGDVPLDDAVDAVRKTIGALPARQAPPIPANARAVRPPQPSPTPTLFTHEGDPDQAFAAIGWNTFGGTDRRIERRALALAGNILQARLFERLREAEGATYSPSAISSTSEELPEWGIFYAAAELKPESTDTFLRIARQAVAELATTSISPEEFERAKNPVLTGIERRTRTNAYWMGALEDFIRQPETIELIRTFESDYAAMTAEDVRAAVATYVVDAPDWSMLVLPAKKSGGGK